MLKKLVCFSGVKILDLYFHTLLIDSPENVGWRQKVPVGN